MNWGQPPDTGDLDGFVITLLVAGVIVLGLLVLWWLVQE